MQGRLSYLLLFSIIAAVLFLPTAGLCDDPPLDSNKFVIDTYNGPQLGTIRTVSLSGAYAGIAEQGQGIMYNPASVAQRVWFSKHMFGYDAGYAYLKPGLIVGDDIDFDNDGDESFNYGDFLIGVIFGSLRINNAGIGADVKIMNFTLGGKDGVEEKLDVLLGHADIAFGYNLARGLIVIGGGIRLGFMDVNVKGMEQSNALTYLSMGPIAGILFRLRKAPLRIGLSITFPHNWIQGRWTDGVSNCANASGDSLKRICYGGDCANRGLIIPDGIAHPWSIRLGFAYYVGKQNWNETWSLEKRKYEYSNKMMTKKGKTRWSPWMSQYDMERSDKDRRYLLIALDIEVVGGLRNGIGIEGFLDQKWQRSGETPTVSLHLGAETEVWADYLILRWGGYAEPSRFKRTDYRIHATMGFDLKLFSICWGSSRLNVRGSTAFDVAEGYFNAGFSVGFWK